MEPKLLEMDDELLPQESTARSAIGDGKSKSGRMPSVDRVATAHGGPHAVATLASRQLRLDEEQRALQISKIAGVQNLDPGIVLSVERRRVGRAAGILRILGRVEPEAEVKRVQRVGHRIDARVRKRVVVTTGAGTGGACATMKVSSLKRPMKRP